jgi:hypothetical protein
MKSPCCLSVYPSVSVHLSVYFEAYEITFLSACISLPNCCYEAYEITLLSVFVYPPTP